jgi:CMP-N-acetylneuraminic acid synthetase
VETAAIIPMRKGSKGVEDKNMREVAGRPLWLWTLDAAVRAAGITKIFVTTDYPFEELYKQYHDKFPRATVETERIGRSFRYVERPSELATDEAPMDPVLVHTVDFFDFHGVVVLLQPTVPIRREGLIDECLRCFKAFPTAKSLVTMNSLHFVWNGESGHQLNERVNRQDMTQKLYQEDGSVYVVHSEDLRANTNRVVYPVICYETPRTVDIDTEDDLALAEFLLNRQKEEKR